MGILLYELLHGFAPFSKKGTSVEKMLEEINLAAKNGIIFNPEISQNAKNLITLILNINPENRPSFEQILSHVWIIEN